MKKKTILVASVALCVLLIAGVILSPFMQQNPPVASSEPPFSGTGEIISIPPEEPVIDNTALPMTDIAVDLHRIPAASMEPLTPYQASWQSLCDVLGEEETSFTFASSEEKGVLLEAVRQLVYASQFSLNEAGLTVAIQYADSYAEDCLLLAAVAESILAENVFADAIELEIAVILYTYLTTNVELVSGNTPVFQVFDQYRGNAAAICSAFCFLLQQFDIPTAVIHTENTTLAAAKINGQCLYFSIGDEMKKDDVRGLSCFGMSENEAKQLCGTFTPPLFAADCAPYTMDGLFEDCTDWRLDAVSHSLYLAYGSSEFTRSISTVDLTQAHG